MNALARGALVVGAGRLKSSNYAKHRRLSWQPRRWQAVDPQKEAQANKLALDERLKSRSEIIRESGRDPEEVWLEIQRENERMEELQIKPAEAGFFTTGGSDASSQDED